MLRQVILILCLAFLCVNGKSLYSGKIAEEDIIDIPGIGRYYYNSERLSWTDAYSVCKGLPGHLVVLESAAEATAIRELMISLGITYIHAGYHDLYMEGKYQTLKGQTIDKLGYSRWTDGFPIGSTSYNCGGLRRTGLVDAICAAVDVSLCELPIPADYELIPGFGYFKQYAGLVDWHGAYALCEADGTHMYVPSSPEEVDAVVARYSITSHMSGVTKLFGTSSWYTIFDEPLETTGYNKWSGGNIPTDPRYIYTSQYGPNGLFGERITDKLWTLCHAKYA